MSFRDYGIGSDYVSYTKDGKKIFDAEYIKIAKLAKEEWDIEIFDFETDCANVSGKNNSCWILFGFTSDKRVKYKTCTTSSRIIKKLEEGRKKKIYPVRTYIYKTQSHGRDTYDIY